MVVSDIDLREHPVPDASTRGKLRIDDRVIRRVAEQAAAEITGRSGRAPRLAVPGHRPVPRASVEVIGRRVRAEVKVSVPGDDSVPGTAQRVRERVAEQIGELTGITADIVDVRVTVVEDVPTPGEADLVLRPAREPTRPGIVRTFGVVLATIIIGLGAVGIFDLLAGLGAVNRGMLSAEALEWLDGRDAATWMVPAGVGVGLLGLWMVVVSVLRSPRRTLPLRATTRVQAGRSAVEALTKDTAAQHPGVLRAEATARRKSVVVRVWTDSGPAVAEEIRGWLRERLHRLAGPPEVRVVVRAKAGHR